MSGSTRIVGGNRATIAQTNFLNAGGIFQEPMARMRDLGQMPEGWEFREYPKMLRIFKEEAEVECSTETIKGTTKTWIEKRQIFDEIIVNSEEEEERVLSGGKTSAQIEEERQGLILRARAAGVRIDPDWSAVRLRRELGDAMDAPVDKMAALEAELASLKKMAAMQAEIELLRAKVAAPMSAPDADNDAGLRNDLRNLGVKVDGRWNTARLREELDRATDGSAAA